MMESNVSYNDENEFNFRNLVKLYYYVFKLKFVVEEALTT